MHIPYGLVVLFTRDGLVLFDIETPGAYCNGIATQPDSCLDPDILKAPARIKQLASGLGEVTHKLFR
jgi:hypothetical protein